MSSTTLECNHPNNKPPCLLGHHSQTCYVNGANGTRLPTQGCYDKRDGLSAWPYWTIGMVVGVVLVVAILIWRYIRDSPYCQNSCNDEMIQKRNRSTAQWCDKYICCCSCCKNCCAPLPSEQASEQGQATATNDQHRPSIHLTNEYSAHPHHSDEVQGHTVVQQSSHIHSSYSESDDHGSADHNHHYDHHRRHSHDHKRHVHVHPTDDVGKALDECTPNHIAFA